MSDELRTQVIEYLDRHNVMTLATVGPQGPWAAAVFYVHDLDVRGGLRLHFLSAPTSRHCARPVTALSAFSRAFISRGNQILSCG